ncbi:MAG: hypothetical protein WEB00_01615 [Dehalococcoidia bacterium]
MILELWHGDSGNLMCDFRTEAEALGVVRIAIAESGADSVLAWGLLQRDDSSGEVRLIAEGSGLADLALSRPAPA